MRRSNFTSRFCRTLREIPPPPHDIDGYFREYAHWLTAVYEAIQISTIEIEPAVETVDEAKQLKFQQNAKKAKNIEIDDSFFANGLFIAIIHYVKNFYCTIIFGIYSLYRFLFVLFHERMIMR